MGIPLKAAKRLNRALYEFHDTNLSGIVERAYQAIAMDEHRGDYDITLWDPKEKPGQTLEQRWFAGAHADVGGGYPDRRLSDITLRWMQDRAVDAGLTVAPVTVGTDNFMAPVTDSFATFLGGLYATMYHRHFRPVLRTAFGNEILDETIGLRRSDAVLAYQPSNDGLPALTA